MSRDYIEIGGAPYGEDCAQVGSHDFSARARAECVALINQLRRMFGLEPEGAALRIKSNTHEFGTYYEVACYYDTDNADSIAYAFNCESEGPEYWDKEAREELGLSVIN